MKWTLLLAFTLAIVAGCEKSNVAEEENISARTTPTNLNTEKNVLTGKWQLVEYFQDRGDGTGQWFPATETEEITFTASGEVKVSGNSTLAMRGFNRYRIVDGNSVELYSTSNENKETFYYNRESDTHLIFNPRCRENCSRRYKLVG